MSKLSIHYLHNREYKELLSVAESVGEKFHLSTFSENTPDHYSVLLGLRVYLRQGNYCGYKLKKAEPCDILKVTELQKQWLTQSIDGIDALSVIPDYYFMDLFNVETQKKYNSKKSVFILYEKYKGEEFFSEHFLDICKRIKTKPLEINSFQSCFKSDPIVLDMCGLDELQVEVTLSDKKIIEYFEQSKLVKDSIKQCNLESAPKDYDYAFDFIVGLNSRKCLTSHFMTKKNNDGTQYLVVAEKYKKRAVISAESLKIGVLSGTFDPPHKGHRHLIKEVVEKFKLDACYVLPLLNNRRKPGARPYSVRLGLVKKAFSGMDRVHFPDGDMELAFEVDRLNGVNRYLKEVYPNSEIYRVAGGDAVTRICKPLRIAYPEFSREHILIGNRADEMPKNDDLSHFKYKEDMQSVNRDQIHYFKVDTDFYYSSTPIRASLRQGIRPMALEDGVFDMIVENGWYDWDTK